MGIRENKVERYLVSEVDKIGGISRKWVCPGVDGVPDRIVIYKTRVYFIEVKVSKPDGVLSSEQIREHVRLKSKGANVRTVYGEVDVDRFISEVKNEQ